jgi:DNA polymerase-3 subunit beta
MARALRDIVAIVPRGHAMEILSDVMVQAADDQVRLTTTNLEMMATRTFKADVTEPVSFTVEANRLSSIMASLSAGSQAKINVGERVSIVAGRSRFNLGRRIADSFPPMPFKNDKVVEFEAGEDLLTAISTVRHAVSTMETEVAWAGVLLEGGDGLNVVATDGKRLAKVALPNATDDAFRATLPTALADMVLKLGASSDAAISVKVGDKSVQFDFGDTVLTGKVIDLAFPAYQRVIPSSVLRTVNLYSVALSDALRRIMLVTDEKSRRVYVSIAKDAWELSNAGRDEGREEVPAALDGEPISIWFNNQLLRDALVAIGADEVVIGINDERGPVKITAPTKEGVTMIVMPQSA